MHQPVDYQLAQPLLETFACDGQAPNVLAAHNMAHDALTQRLQGDPAEAWSLKVIQHGWSEQGVTFHAEFLRNPEFENQTAQ